jgi:hypothetical protein
MLRALLYGLAILHLGPGIAFALLAFGCEGVAPYLGEACGDSVFRSFALFTVVGWLILSVGLAAVLLLRRAASSTVARVWALLALFVLGALVAAAGAWLTGSQFWFLAIPASLAAGWLSVANPLACEPMPPSGAADSHSRKSAA